MKNKVKTIDVNAKEWFDKVNGNSYHAGEVIINYGTKSQSILAIPFSYGYGQQYEQSALKVLQENGYIRPADNMESLYTVCKKIKIVLRSSIVKGCKKRDLK